MMRKPKKKERGPQHGHVFHGRDKRGAHCVHRVPFQLGEITMMVACGWPKSAHRGAPRLFP